MTDAKTYLQQIRVIDTHIIHLQEEIDSLEMIATSTTSAMRPDVVSHSGAGDKIGDCCTAIADYSREITALQKQLLAQKLDAEKLLLAIHDEDQLKVLQLRYFGYFAKSQRKRIYPSFAEIGDLMEKSERQVNNLHGSALLKVNELLKEREGV